MLRETNSKPKSGTPSFLLLTQDQSLAGLLREGLEPAGYCFELRESLSAIVRDPGLAARPVVIDLSMPEALAGLSRLKAYHPEARIISISNGNLAKSEEALRAGASFIIIERENLEPLREALRRIYSELRGRRELEALRAITEPKIVAKSPKMKKLMKSVEGAAAAEETVIVFGEPGSGRQLVAKNIHTLSRRRGMPFVSLAGREEGLAQAMLAARGGTLYIKELGAIEKQAIEGVRDFIRLGEFQDNGSSFKADVRIMAGCACPEDARALDEIPHTGLRMPPLRERLEDIIPLAECFLEELESFLKKGKKHLTKNAKNALLERNYPNNASELKELVHRAYFSAKGASIGEKDLTDSRFAGRHCSVKGFIEERLRGYLKKMADLGHSNLHASVMAEVEKALIELALRETEGNKLRASKALGMNRNTFRSKIRQLKIKSPALKS